MNPINKKLFYFFVNLLSFALVLPVSAGDSNIVNGLLGGINETGIALRSQDRGFVVSQFIQFFLVFAGVVFFINMIVAGYKWMMARGNEEQINQAKRNIVGSIIGLIIFVSAYVISFAVIEFFARPGGPIQT